MDLQLDFVVVGHIVVTSARKMLDSNCHFIQIVRSHFLDHVPVSGGFLSWAAAVGTRRGWDGNFPFHL